MATITEGGKGNTVARKVIYDLPGNILSLNTDGQ